MADPSSMYRVANMDAAVRPDVTVLEMTASCSETIGYPTLFLYIDAYKKL